MRVLVTGGAGFIGSAFVRYALTHHRDVHVVTVDALTYAGNLENLEAATGNPRHRFVHGDIRDAQALAAVFGDEKIDTVVHFAAESHVDRSILSPDHAIDTNVRGTGILLEAAPRRKGVAIPPCFDRRSLRRRR